MLYPSEARMTVNHEMEMEISCRDCVRRHTSDCDDCLVTFVLGEEPERLSMTSDDAEIVQLLTSEGLVPRLKFVSISSRPGGTDERTK
jgi:hypothetical protein